MAKFENTEFEYIVDSKTIATFLKKHFGGKRSAAMPSVALPVAKFSFDDVLAAPDNTGVKLGHSSLLLKVNGQVILVDPVFSERASPVQWAGPKRFHESPIELADIPYVDIVLISHNHYDHLDKGSIAQLKNKTEQFITTLKVGDQLVKWGVDASKIIELDWWQSVNAKGIEFVAAPTQHFSGRSLFDRDQSFWASFVIRTPETNVFFSGDSGYFSGFKEIGKKYGPFDLTFVETGAYNEAWQGVHMIPEESLKTHLDLKGKVMMPIHNATFDLALHDWDEPLERITKLAEQNDVELSTPVFGEFFALNYSKGNGTGSDTDSAISSERWWRSLK
ncbi:MBL fold metallo-hydrolase [Thalassotalea euphylliae]|uniref:Hydrolase n=1 Tax=Thalassotalea euphylliae TaxID=1655234 RepID=A0A3E0UC71_9GAMM|nr:MBL fold metallo-hydrolase [Thalassotalea euphylliae]REL34611.1 hydrolase [Thalassotalea euphylliae]